MTKEQEEAIEICSKITEDDLLNCWEGGEKEYKAIQVVLNLIQEQQEEMEIKQNRIQELEKALIDNNYKYKVEIEKKDKMIDLMAEWLCDDDTSFGYGKLKEVNTTKRIKQYFENQAKM